MHTDRVIFFAALYRLTPCNIGVETCLIVCLFVNYTSNNWLVNFDNVRVGGSGRGGFVT